MTDHILEPILHQKTFRELTTDELYELLRVRSEVFVVEQNCVYQDMDGDDQKSIHLWLQTSGYTVQLNVKFRKAVPTTEPELTIRAKVSKQVRNLAYISAEITNSKGELCNEGEAIYFLMNEEKAKEMGFLHCEVEE